MWLKRVLGWVVAVTVTVAVGAVVWNLPQGRPIEAVPAGDGDMVVIGRQEAGFDEKAFENARTLEELKQVKGLHLGTTNP